MLILQIPPRAAKFSGESLPRYPAPVTIHVELGPKELFGVEKLSGKLPHHLPGQQVQATADLRRGGIRFAGGQSLPTLVLECPFFDAALRMQGDVATIVLECSSEDSFKRAISMAENMLPAIVSGAVDAPVYTLDVYGNVGDQYFHMEALGSTRALFRSMDLPAEIRTKLERLREIPDAQSARVFSAHRYLLQARRLRYAATFAGEFVGERLLNLYKAVEILFGRKVTELRPALIKLGLREEVIDMIVGLVYVRDEGDVGHPALQALTREQYETVHSYSIGIEEIIAWLLDHVVDAVTRGDFTLPSRDAKPSKRIATLARVAKNIRQVKPLQPDTFLAKTI